MRTYVLINIGQVLGRSTGILDSPIDFTQTVPDLRQHLMEAIKEMSDEVSQ